MEYNSVHSEKLQAALRRPRGPARTNGLWMKSSTKDRIKGRIQEAKGKVKEKAGRAARDPDLQDRGTAEKVGGKAQRKLGEIKKVFGK